MPTKKNTVEVELAVQLGYRFGLVKGSFLQLQKFEQTSQY